MAPYELVCPWRRTLERMASEIKGGREFRVWGALAGDEAGAARRQADRAHTNGGADVPYRTQHRCYEIWRCHARRQRQIALGMEGGLHWYSISSRSVGAVRCGVIYGIGHAMRLAARCVRTGAAGAQRCIEGREGMEHGRCGGWGRNEWCLRLDSVRVRSSVGARRLAVIFEACAALVEGSVSLKLKTAGRPPLVTDAARFS